MSLLSLLRGSKDFMRCPRQDATASKSDRSTPILIVCWLAKLAQPFPHQDKIQAHKPHRRTGIFDVTVLLAAPQHHQTWKIQSSVGPLALAMLSWVDGCVASASAPTVTQEGLPQSTRGSHAVRVRVENSHSAARPQSLDLLRGDPGLVHPEFLL